MDALVRARESIFLSYSRTDADAAGQLRAALQAAGFQVFQDEISIRSGERWLTRLQQALDGCTAFVVLIGRDGVRRWVGAEVEVALVRHFSPHEDEARLPIFPVLLEGTAAERLPPLLALHQAVHWSASEPVPPSLLDSIAQHEIRSAVEPFEGCPFVGLQAFQRADARIFFGRRAETLEALSYFGDQLESDPEQLSPRSSASFHRWVQIEGNSGAGKSSLVRAGLLPLIEQGALWARTGFEHWRVLDPMRPGQLPLANLAEVIERGLIDEPTQRDSLARLHRLEADERALAFMLRDFKQPGTAFLLLVDQFEELLTSAVAPDSAEARSRNGFDAVVANALLDLECPLFLLSTVRADFLHRFDRLPRLAPLVNRCCGRYLLPSMSETGLCEIIEAPARLAGLDVREIKESMLAEARNEPGALPLVEHALAMLWEASAGSARLSGEYFRTHGGLVGLLARGADALLARLEREVKHGRHAALELLLRLTRISAEGGQHTRRRIAREEAVEVAGAGNAARGEQVLLQLSGGADPGTEGRGSLRLVLISHERDEATGQDVALVDLIHETLVRARRGANGKLEGYWPQLYAYIEKHRDRDLAHQQLELQRQRLEQKSRRWHDSRWFGSVWYLASAAEWWRVRKHRVDDGSPLGRYLTWSRRKLAAQVLLILSVLATLGESLAWTYKNDLPVSYTFIQPLWYLGYRPLPEMKEIEAGSFTMGCVPGRDGGECNEDEIFPAQLNPVHVPKFRMGKYEVTFLEYDFYVWQDRRRRPELRYPLDQGWGRHRRPVINVSWDEARAYARWLSTETGSPFALPGEVEWEYAARAQTNTAYWWGATAKTANGVAHANCADCGSAWDKLQSAPVGSFPANPVGLHDTAGNVFEWVQDEYEERYTAVDLRCSRISREPSRQSSDSQLRVLRGGSWASSSRFARAVPRNYVNPPVRYYFIGFRVCGVAPIEE